MLVMRYPAKSVRFTAIEYAVIVSLFAVALLVGQTNLGARSSAEFLEGSGVLVGESAATSWVG